MTTDTHKHFCPFCGEGFDCAVPFCDTVINLMCDPCWDKPKETPTPAPSYERVAEYMSGKAAA